MSDQLFDPKALLPYAQAMEAEGIDVGMVANMVRDALGVPQKRPVANPVTPVTPTAPNPPAIPSGMGTALGEFAKRINAGNNYNEADVTGFRTLKDWLPQGAPISQPVTDAQNKIATTEAYNDNAERFGADIPGVDYPVDLPQQAPASTPIARPRISDVANVQNGEDMTAQGDQIRFNPETVTADQIIQAGKNRAILEAQDKAAWEKIKERSSDTNLSDYGGLVGNSVAAGTTKLISDPLAVAANLTPKGSIRDTLAGAAEYLNDTAKGFERSARAKLGGNDTTALLGQREMENSSVGEAGASHAFNPALLAMEGAESAPGTAAGAIVGRQAFKYGAKKALEAGAEKKAAEEIGSKVGTKAAQVTEGLQEAFNNTAANLYGMDGKIKDDGQLDTVKSLLANYIGTRIGSKVSGGGVDAELVRSLTNKTNLTGFFAKAVNANKEIFKSMGSEGLEEFAQNFFQSVLEDVTDGKVPDMDKAFKQAMKAAPVGAATGGVMRGPSAVAESFTPSAPQAPAQAETPAQPEQQPVEQPAQPQNPPVEQSNLPAQPAEQPVAEQQAPATQQTNTEKPVEKTTETAETVRSTPIGTPENGEKQAEKGEKEQEKTANSVAEQPQEQPNKQAETAEKAPETAENPAETAGKAPESPTNTQETGANQQETATNQAEPASNNEAQASVTMDDVRVEGAHSTVTLNKQLSEDKDLGRAYTALRDNGWVRSVETEADLPEELRTRLENGDVEVHRSEDGKHIQGIYDRRTKRAYLVASNLSRGTAMSTFVHEVGVHAAADTNHKAWKPILERGAQIVRNGAKRGDAVCQRALEAAKKAGVENDPNELTAYLVAEARKERTRERATSPIKSFLKDLATFIRSTLYYLGVPKNILNDRALLDIAETAIDQMGSNVKRTAGEAAEKEQRQDKREQKKQAKLDEQNEEKGREKAAEMPVEEETRSEEEVERSKGPALTQDHVEREEPSEPVTLDNNEDEEVEEPETEENNYGKKGTVGRVDPDVFFEKDEVGGRRLRAGRKLFDRAMEAIRQKHPEWTMPSDKLEQVMIHRAAYLQASKEQLDNILEALATFSKGDRELISDILEDELEKDYVPTDAIVEMAEAIKKMMVQQTNQLVRLGMLDPEEAKRWTNSKKTYIPRLYEKYAENGKDGKKVINEQSAMGNRKPIRGISGKELIDRGEFTTVHIGITKDGKPDKGEYDRLINTGWEPRDDVMVDADGAYVVFDKKKMKLVDSADVVMWRDYPKKWRKEHGEVRDVGARLVAGYMRTQNDIALASLFKTISKNEQMCSDEEKPGWVKVEEIIIPNTNQLRFGCLSGKWVSPEVYAQLKPFKEELSPNAKLWRSLIADWKLSKTALNPSTHVNNVVGNVLLSALAGANIFTDTKLYWEAFQELRTQSGKDFELAKKAGLFSGDVIHEDERAEKSAIAEKILKSAGLTMKEVNDTSWQDNALMCARFARKAMTAFADDAMIKLYGSEDTLFKYAIFKKARKAGTSAANSCSYANKFIFRYDTLPSGAKKFRDNFAPFFAWSFQAIPLMARVLTEYPHRFVGASLILNGLMNVPGFIGAMAFGGGDDDDDNRLYKFFRRLSGEQSLLPAWMSTPSPLMTNSTMHLWQDSVTGKTLMWDVGHWLMADLFQMHGYVPSAFEWSTPGLGLFEALCLGRDGLGRDLSDRTDRENGGPAFLEAYRILTPEMNVFWGAKMEKIVQATYNTMQDNEFVKWVGGNLGLDGRFKGKEVQLISTILDCAGFKFKEVDFGEQAKYRMKAEDREISAIRRDVKSEATSAMAENYFDIYTQKAADKIYERMLRKQWINQKLYDALCID